MVEADGSVDVVVEEEASVGAAVAAARGGSPRACSDRSLALRWLSSANGGCASCTAAATWRRTSSGRGKYTSVARWEEEEVELRSGVVGSAVMCTTAAVFPWLDVWLGCDASPRCAASP